MVTFRQTRARKLRLAPSSRELGNESTKWGTVRSQRPGDRISTPRVADDTLADQLRVLVGPIAHQEAWATSKLLLTYGIMRRDSRAGDSLLPARRKRPHSRHFFLAAPPRPPPRRQSPRKASFPPVGPLPRGQPPWPTAPPAAPAPPPTCPRAR